MTVALEGVSRWDVRSTPDSPSILLASSGRVIPTVGILVFTL